MARLAVTTSKYWHRGRMSAARLYLSDEHVSGFEPGLQRLVLVIVRFQALEVARDMRMLLACPYRHFEP
jgi:hypothetical protein